MQRATACECGPCPTAGEADVLDGQVVASLVRPTEPVALDQHPRQPRVARPAPTGALLPGAREHDLLPFLMPHPGVWFTRQELLERVWRW